MSCWILTWLRKSLTRTSASDQLIEAKNIRSPRDGLGELSGVTAPTSERYSILILNQLINSNRGTGNECNLSNSARPPHCRVVGRRCTQLRGGGSRDNRKSTRLNSSH